MRKKLSFIEPDSKAYQSWRLKIALDYCPPIYPCADCGAPAVKGYCCCRCDSVDPRDGEDSEDICDA